MPRGQYDRSKFKKEQTMTTEQDIQAAPAPVAYRENTVESRPQEEAKARRRRNADNLDGAMVLRLGLPPGIEEKYPDHVFRWVNDEGNRVHVLTKEDDYDIVEEVPGRPVGTDQGGKPINAVLLRKPKEFAEEDRRAKLDRVQTQEKAALRSASPDAAWKNPDAAISSGDGGKTFALSGNSIGYKP